MISVFKITRPTKIVFIVVVSVCIAGLIIAWLYYRGINQSEDPRILSSRFMLSRYDQLISRGEYSAAISVLDSAEKVFMLTPDYNNSFEIGLLLNNRASVFISRALYDDADSALKQVFLDTALNFLLRGIDQYEQWYKSVEKLSVNELQSIVKPFFSENDPALKGKNVDRFIRKRVKDILLARKEMPRRLSVAYTNLGIIQRHQYKQAEALESYMKAIRLWKDNPAALGNLNVLYGKPWKDRSILKKLFPPERNS
jgi:tetratricopeptide (TPR) repeat protein